MVAQGVPRRWPGPLVLLRTLLLVVVLLHVFAGNEVVAVDTPKESRPSAASGTAALRQRRGDENPRDAAAYMSFADVHSISDSSSWVMNFVGKPFKSVASTVDSLLTIATENNFIAQVDPYSSKLYWRYHYPPTQKVLDIATCGNAIVSLSFSQKPLSGYQVMVWNNGLSLVKTIEQSLLPFSKNAKIFCNQQPGGMADKVDVVLVSGGKSLLLEHSREQPMSLSQSMAVDSVRFTSDGIPFGLRRHSTGAFSVFYGPNAAKIAVPFDSSSKKAAAILSDIFTCSGSKKYAFLSWQDEFKIYEIATDFSTVIEVSSKIKLPKDLALMGSKVSFVSDMQVVSSAVVRIENSKNADKVTYLDLCTLLKGKENPILYDGPIPLNEASSADSLALVFNSHVKLVLLEQEQGVLNKRTRRHFTLRIPYASDFPPSKVFIGRIQLLNDKAGSSYPAINKVSAFSVSVVLENGSVLYWSPVNTRDAPALVKKSFFLAARHEALASTESLLLVDYPPPHSWEDDVSEKSTLFSHWKRRVLSHSTRFAEFVLSIDINNIIIQLQDFALSLHGALNSASGKKPHAQFKLSEKTNDETRKIAIALTKSGTVYGVQTSSPEDIMWLVNVARQDAVPVSLLQTKPTSGSNPALVTILYSNGAYTTIDSTTGTRKDQIEPSNQGSPQETLARLLNATVYYTVSKKSSVQGAQRFHLVGRTSSESKGNVYAVPLDGEVLASWGTRAGVTPTASAGRVMADRSVRYKYINPNMLVLASRVEGSSSSLSVKVLDALTGDVLSSFRKNDVDLADPVSRPVHIVAGSSWAVVVYFDIKYGWVATAIDLFLPPETMRDEKTMPWATPAHLLGASTPPSVWGAPDVYVSTFILRTRDIPRAVGVSVTRNGVTVQDVVVVTSRSVITIPRRFLDGVRAYVGQSFTAEDNVLTYSSDIHVEDTRVLSRENEVIANKVTTAPTEFESTSAMMAFGCDLFWGTIAPSGDFDRLSKTFAKIPLLILCSSLAVLTLIARYLLRERTLKSMWC